MLDSFLKSKKTLYFLSTCTYTYTRINTINNILVEIDATLLIIRKVKERKTCRAVSAQCVITIDLQISYLEQ